MIGIDPRKPAVYVAKQAQHHRPLAGGFWRRHAWGRSHGTKAFAAIGYLALRIRAHQPTLRS
jgi:hypothetical protein